MQVGNTTNNTSPNLFCHVSGCCFVCHFDHRLCSIFSVFLCWYCFTHPMIMLFRYFPTYSFKCSIILPFSLNILTPAAPYMFRFQIIIIYSLINHSPSYTTTGPMDEPQLYYSRTVHLFRSLFYCKIVVYQNFYCCKIMYLIFTNTLDCSVNSETTCGWCIISCDILEELPLYESSSSCRTFCVILNGRHFSSFDFFENSALSLIQKV